ncbi:MAG: hypothetical protein HAW62_01995 [Endozoicomonadaceae bacterium]|nr:hypothetical protein [Endozoicomonadaceae bacterium]
MGLGFRQPLERLRSFFATRHPKQYHLDTTYKLASSSKSDSRQTKYLYNTIKNKMLSKLDSSLHFFKKILSKRVIVRNLTVTEDFFVNMSKTDNPKTASTRLLDAANPETRIKDLQNMLDKMPQLEAKMQEELSKSKEKQKLDSHKEENRTNKLKTDVMRENQVSFAKAINSMSKDSRYIHDKKLNVMYSHGLDSDSHHRRFDEAFKEALLPYEKSHKIKQQDARERYESVKSAFFNAAVPSDGDRRKVNEAFHQCLKLETISPADTQKALVEAAIKYKNETIQPALERAEGRLKQYKHEVDTSVTPVPENTKVLADLSIVKAVDDELNGILTGERYQDSNTSPEEAIKLASVSYLEQYAEQLGLSHTISRHNVSSRLHELALPSEFIERHGSTSDLVPSQTNLSEASLPPSAPVHADLLGLDFPQQQYKPLVASRQPQPTKPAYEPTASLPPSAYAWQDSKGYKPPPKVSLLPEDWENGPWSSNNPFIGGTPVSFMPQNISNADMDQASLFATVQDPGQSSAYSNY